MSARSYSWALLYDSDCGFCRWSLAWVLRADRRLQLRPVALDSGEADTLVGDLPDDARYASFHLIAPDGLRWSAGAAAAPLLRLLPGGRGPAALLARAPGATARAYAWVASHRTAISRFVPARSKARADAVIARRA